MKRTIPYDVALMLISPLISVYVALKNNNSQYKKWVFIFFITIYGSILQFAYSADGTRHLERVYGHYSSLSFNEFQSELIDIITFSPQPDTNDDVFIHVLSYFTGTVLDMPYLFFVFVAFIYGFFYVSSMMKVLELSNLNKNLLSRFFFIFAFLFILWKSIEGVNTVRTWTGGWILFYGFLRFQETRKWRYLILLAVTPLIHIAYFAMSIPAWIVCFLGLRPKLYISLFLISFFISINPQGIISNINTTDLGKDKIESYYEEGREATYDFGSRSGNWYVRYGKKGLNNWGIILLAFLLILYGGFSEKMTKTAQMIFSMGLVFIAFANFMNFIPALNNRTMVNAGMYILATMVYVLKDEGRQGRISILKPLPRLGLYVSMLLMLPFIFFQFSNLTNYISLFVLALPFAPWINEDINLSIREFMGWFL